MIEPDAFLNVFLVKDIEHAPTQASSEGNENLVGEENINRDKGFYVGVEDDLNDESNEQSYNKYDDLGDIWQEMTFAIECSKVLLMISHLL